MSERAIQSLETIYRGCRFRSRLEARWAIFFDVMEERWEYEPENFRLPNGVYYLPDFWLPEMRVWLEIKGPAPTEEEREKVILLAKMTRQPVLLFNGAPTEEKGLLAGCWCQGFYSAKFYKDTFSCMPGSCRVSGGRAFALDVDHKDERLFTAANLDQPLRMAVDGLSFANFAADVCRSVRFPVDSVDYLKELAFSEYGRRVNRILVQEAGYSNNPMMPRTNNPLRLKSELL